MMACARRRTPTCRHDTKHKALPPIAIYFGRLFCFALQTRLETCVASVPPPHVVANPFPVFVLFSLAGVQYLGHAVISKGRDCHRQGRYEDANHRHEAAQEDDEGQHQRPADTQPYQTCRPPTRVKRHKSIASRHANTAAK